LIENRFTAREFGNTIDMFVGVEEIVIAGMRYALVPKKTFSTNMKFV
jgi:hypothetical protein